MSDWVDVQDDWVDVSSENDWRDIAPKKSFKDFLLTPISKQLTGKSLGERANLLNKSAEAIEKEAGKTGRKVGVFEAFSRQLPAATAQAGINLVDISPLDIGIMAGTAGLGKVPIRGVPLGKIASKIPVGKGFFKNIDEFARYQRTLKAMTPLSSRGVTKAIAPKITSPIVSEVLLKELPIENQKLAYNKFIKQGNQDTFEGFIKQFGNSQFSKEGKPIEVSWNIPEILEPFVERAKQLPRQEFIEKYNQGLKAQNLTVRDTAKNIDNLIKKSGFSSVEDFYDDVISKPISTKTSVPAKTSDFAENINLTKYPPDVRQTISNLISEKPGLGKTPTISDAELVSRASQLKNTPTIKYLSNLPEGTVEAEALKVRQGNVESIRQAIGGELGGLKNQLDDIIQGGISTHRKIASIFGRGLRQQRLPADTQQKMAFAIDDTIVRIKKDPIFSKDQELIDTVRKLRGIVVDKEFNPTAWNKVYYAWINSILSNPWTHLVNTASNTLFTIAKIPEKFASAVMDLPLAVKTGKRTQFFGEIPAMLKGLVSKEPLPSGVAAGTKLDVWSKPIRGKTGEVIGLPVKALQIEDNLAKSVIGRMEYYAQKYAGKTGEALLGAVREEQLYRTFQNDAGVIADTLLVIRRRIPGLRYVVPFVKTPANLIARGLERTPLVLGKILHKARTGTYTQEALSKDLGNLALGTIGTAWMGLQWAKGNITGRAPSSPTERDAFYRQGKKPNAIRIGNKWIPLERLEPIGTSFSVVANLMQDYKNSNKETPPEKALDAITALGATLVNKTYLSGFTNMVKALSDPAMYGQSFLRRIASGAEPQLLKFFADLKDPYYREANTILDQFKIKTPFLSETLPPKLNIFGEPVKRDFMNIGTVKESPLEEMISETPIGFPGKMLGKEKMTSQEYHGLLKTTGGQIKQVLRALDKDKFMGLPVERREQVIDRITSEERTPERQKLRIQKALGQSDWVDVQNDWVDVQ